MKHLLLLLVLVTTLSSSISAQNVGYYYKYDFKNYLQSKTKNPEEYLKRLKENITYPAIARENEIEGKLDFILMNNANNQTDVMLKKHNIKSSLKTNHESLALPFLIEVQIALKKIDESLLNHNTEKFITEFSIIFELEASTTFSDLDKKAVDVIITEKRVTFILIDSP